jgi:hypothetical protein
MNKNSTESTASTFLAHANADDNGVLLERVDARRHKEDVIALYERNGNREFAARFDWYYREQGQETPISWTLRDGNGELYGVGSVTIRPMRYRKTRLRAGVAGNLLVDRRKGNYLAAVSLVRAMKSLVSVREIDVLLGIPNALSAPIFMRVDFKIIDRWTSHAFIQGSRNLLQNHFGWRGRLASPIVDLLAATKGVLSRKTNLGPANLHFVNMTDGDLNDLQMQFWAPPEKRFVISPSSQYLYWRFLRDPVNRHEVEAIVGLSGKPCGYVVVRYGADRSWISDCYVDNSQISELAAIYCRCHSEQTIGTSIWIAHLRSCALSSQLGSAGLMPTPASFGGYPDLPLVGFWLAEHPLAHEFSQPDSWDIYTGLNDV